MSIKIALAGNPNSGKTTLFNALTGSNQYVGNWPGVTVEKKEGKLKGYKDVTIIDLPGIYSLSPYTLEEVVSRNYLIDERPDAILNIVDGTNIERNLFLSTQLTELGIPVVMAINMMDIVEKNGDVINTASLSKALGCKVVEISALKGTGVMEAAQAAVKMAENGKTVPQHSFSGSVEHAIAHIEEAVLHDLPDEQQRWYAIKLFERDEKIIEKLKLEKSTLNHIEDDIKNCEAELDDDSESIITTERYQYIDRIIKNCCKVKNKGKMSTSDKIDKVVTNRWLALPIFAIIMFIVYAISVTTVGTVATDWANDGVFGDGWHLLGIGSADYEKATGNYDIEIAKRDAYIDAAEEAGIDVEAMRAALEEESDEDVIKEFLEQASSVGITAEAKIEDEDGNVAEIIPVTIKDFETALKAEEPDPASFGVWVQGIPVLIENLLDKIETADWLKSLILEGIIAGVGAVLGFVPQILILFIFLGFLEGCGYMARIAFILDRIFRRFGLSGKSFIPMLIGSGCSVPGIMASRTIENDRDRKMTIMTTSFIPCGAKLPVIAMIAGALFGGSVWIGPSAYFVGIVAVVCSGIILKKTKMFEGDVAPFVMELPAYHWPTVGSVLRSMWERGWSFIKKAGTIILLSTIAVWFASNYGWDNGTFGQVDMDNSILAAIGNTVSWIFAPLGWGNWRASVAAVTGLVAKENIVGTFGILYGFGEVAENGREVWGTLSASFTALSAYSFLIFNLLCAPCFAAMGAIRREMNNRKWFWFAIGYQTGLGYIVALTFYQLAMLFTKGLFGFGTVVAILAVILFAYMLLRKKKDINKPGSELRKGANI